MYYAGIDAHRSYLTVAIVDASDEMVREQKRVPIGDGEPLLEALDVGFPRFSGQVRIADQR